MRRIRATIHSTGQELFFETDVQSAVEDALLKRGFEGRGYNLSFYKAEEIRSSGGIRSLQDIFSAQATLNTRCGRDPRMLVLGNGRFDWKLAGAWINDYIDAVSNELEELRNCMFWKHWCKEAQGGQRYLIHDTQNARVELIDLVFFVVSIALCLGLDADEIFRLYEEKLKVNHKRQEVGYSMKDKDEEDNRSIK